MRCYWSGGVEAVSLNEICRRAKVSKPALYREFGSEDGLMQAVLSNYYEKLLSKLHQLFKRDGSFDDTLNLLIESALQASASLGYPAGCLFVGMSNSASRTGPATQNEINELQDKILSTYKDWFEQSKSRGEFRSDITPEFAAIYLHAQLSNAMNQQARGESAQTIKNVLQTAVSVFR